MHLFSYETGGRISLNVSISLPIQDSAMDDILRKAMKSKRSVQTNLPLTQEIGVAFNRFPMHVSRKSQDNYLFRFDSWWGQAIEMFCQKLGYGKTMVDDQDPNHAYILAPFGYGAGRSLFGYPVRFYEITNDVSLVIYIDKTRLCATRIDKTAGVVRDSQTLKISL